MKTIFFDWGGVVANDPGDDFLTKILQDIGANPEQIQEIFQLYMKRFMKGEISEAEYWDELSTNYGFVIQDSISDEFKKWSGLVANEDILALVDEAKDKGWQTAILSNVIEPTYNVLKSAGFYDRFDMIIASCKEGFAKPDIKIYELALERAGATPGESIFIDDKQNNLDPANEMGFATVLASNPTQIIQDVRALL
jgi:putative hydrolase of the HAD superfamily